MRFTIALALAALAAAQDPQTPAGPRPARVEVTPARIEVEVGQTLRFTAAGFDEEGRRLDVTPTAWFAAPFDVAAADETGAATFFLPREAKGGAGVGGQPAFATAVIQP